MPIDWKANISFKTFIARRETPYKRRHSAAHTNGSLIRSNSSMKQVQNRSSAEDQPAIAQSPTVKDNKDLHDAEGTLEMQKMLLGKLARRENNVKG